MRSTSIVLFLGLCCFCIATDNIVRKRHASAPKCKGATWLGWEVRDFVSIISWKRRKKCAPKFGNYTVEMCLFNCNKKTGDWAKVTCPRNKPENKKKNFFSCKSDISSEALGPSIRVCYTYVRGRKKKKVCSPKDYRDGPVKSRSTFSSPLVAAKKSKPTAVWGTIQEPTNNFLCAYDKLEYTVKIADITAGNKTICQSREPTSKLLEAVFDTTIIKLSNKNFTESCHKGSNVLQWEFNKHIEPDSSYCIFGSYQTDVGENPNGPSDFSYVIATTPPEVEDISSTLVAFLASVSLIVIVILALLVVMLRRWRQSIKKINEIFQAGRQINQEEFEKLCKYGRLSIKDAECLKSKQQKMAEYSHHTEDNCGSYPRRMTLEVWKGMNI